MSETMNNDDVRVLFSRMLGVGVMLYLQQDERWRSSVSSSSSLASALSHVSDLDHQDDDIDEVCWRRFGCHLQPDLIVPLHRESKHQNGI